MQEGEKEKLKIQWKHFLDFMLRDESTDVEIIEVKTLESLETNI